jgi:hemerythrin-like domain-containing protein
MADLLAIIEKIMEEHKIILADFQALENISNDAGALIILEKGKDVFKPGQLSPRDGLIKLNEMRNIVAIGIEAHFYREETALLKGLREYGQPDFVTALKTLLNEHLDIRNELNVLKSHIEELQTEKLSRMLWESRGYDLRARISQLHKTMAAHAANEQILLHKVEESLVNRTK